MTTSACSVNGFVATGTGGGCAALIKKTLGFEIIVTSIDEPSIPSMAEEAQVTIRYDNDSVSFSLPDGTLKHFLESIQE